MATSNLEAFLAERRDVIVVGVRKDGRPHATPNWFWWDGSKFYVSTTRHRVKYRMFRRDPRVQLLIDDDPGHRTVSLYGTVEVHEDVAAELSRFRAIREKYGRQVPSDDEFKAELTADERVLLAITPDGPPESWTVRDID